MRLTEAERTVAPVLVALLANLKQGWYAIITREDWGTVAPILHMKGAGWVAQHIGSGVAVFADQSPGVPEPFGITAPGHGLALGFMTGLAITDRLEVCHGLAGKIAGGLKDAAEVGQKVAEVAALRNVIDRMRERVQAAGKTAA